MLRIDDVSFSLRASPNSYVISSFVEEFGIFSLNHNRIAFNFFLVANFPQPEEG